jgi:hypothetical protein
MDRAFARALLSCLTLWPQQLHLHMGDWHACCTFWNHIAAGCMCHPTTPAAVPLSSLPPLLPPTWPVGRLLLIVLLLDTMTPPLTCPYEICSTQHIVVV